ncbi:hypothetical protein F383_07116 [Gossypium arboreum]|uniref:Uncharacterized protein n=1 Tax=Gossypium arboreum TaxID=29729 RepID=A0A0B0PGM1_GOSAR|nr:hypothetical protein F383_07116 [Gossypium arboreum]
MRALILLLQEL